MSVAGTKPVLYVKAAKDGKSVGDCPFSHKARLALESKNVEHELKLIDLGNKPKWYLDINKDGTVPSLVIGEKKITSSDDILTYADENGKGEKLGDCTTGMDEAGKVFGAFVSFMKAKENSALEEAKEKLTKALEDVNGVLEKSGGPFMSGKKFGTVDCNLTPKLYAIKIAGKHYKVRFPNISLP